MSFKIILADDHPLILTGIRSLIDQITPHCEVIAEAYQVSDLLNLLQQHHCDLLITDFSMPGDTRSDGLVMIQQLRRDYPNLPIIVLTQIQNSAILQSLIQAGVKGLILKKSVINELADAIRQILPAIAILARQCGCCWPVPVSPGKATTTRLRPRRVKWYACWPAACRSLRSPTISITASKPSAPRKRVP